MDEVTTKPLHMVVHPGIGDFSWVYSKFCHLERGISITIAEDAKHKRCEPFVHLLPGVKESNYGNGTKDYVILKKTWNATYEEILEAETSGQRIYISANNWLDKGNRLENWIPDLPTEFHYPIMTTDDHVQEARKWTPPGSMYFCFHTASLEGMKVWDTWGPGEWLDFFLMLHSDFPNVVLVAIGAKWDTTMTNIVVPLARKCGIEVADAVGKTDMGTSIEIIRRCRYFIGFASGMTILANVIMKPCLMLYHWSLEKLMYSWPSPESLSNGSYTAMLWTRPKETYRKVYPLIERSLEY